MQFVEEFFFGGYARRLGQADIRYQFSALAAPEQ
jgi:hypothetical protein